MKTRIELLGRIQRYLISSGMSATRLCQKAGVDHHAISRLKTDKSITLQTIEHIERILPTEKIELKEG
jgi:DNA-binding Xre family transcriptional regulator